MKTNVGTTDKLIRIILALLLGTLFLTDTASGALGMVFLIFAIVLIATSLIGFCPLYTLLGINTCSINSKKS